MKLMELNFFPLSLFLPTVDADPENVQNSVCLLRPQYPRNHRVISGHKSAEAVINAVKRSQGGME